MADLQIGRHGVILLVVLFLLLAAEDVLIWVESGVVPGVEFFLASLVVGATMAYVIREVQKYEPP